MTSKPTRILVGLCLLGSGSLAVSLVADAQQPNRPAPPAAAGGQPEAESSATPQTEDEQREALWNSPGMLRARAWVTDYCQNSEKMSPEEGQKYMSELENLTPAQMKLWLLQYEHQQELYVQKESAKQVAHRAATAHASASIPSPEQMKMWQMAHQASLQQAMAVDRSAQQSLNNISDEESRAAAQEQGQLNTQRAEAFQMQQNKQADLNNPYPNYGYGGYGGGMHYHFHLYQ